MLPYFAALIDRVEQEELERLRLEIAELEQTAIEGRVEMDGFTAQGQSAVADLRNANPDLNDREEQLKAEVVRYQDEYAQAFEEMEALDDSPLGWLVHAGKIGRFKKVQRTAKKNQSQAMVKLRVVRQDWLEKVEAAGEVQSELRERWQGLGVTVSEARGRVDHLCANLESLAEQAAVRRVLEELDSPYDVTGELGEKLEDLAQRNAVRVSYQEGLGAAAEALGYLKGIGKGLGRFRSSVGDVIREQRRYKLAKVAIMLPQSVATMNQTWKQFHDRISDDREMADKPVAFAELVQQYFTRRLTDETIKSFFEQMGSALNQATRKWG